jgi:hypothetical protein
LQEVNDGAWTTLGSLIAFRDWLITVRIYPSLSFLNNIWLQYHRLWSLFCLLTCCQEWAWQRYFMLSF